MEAEGGGVFFEAFDFLLAVFFFGFGPDGGVVGFLIFEEVPENAGQLVGHRGDGLGGAQSGFPAAETVAQIILGIPQHLRPQPLGFGGPTFDVPRFHRQNPPAGDAVVRATQANDQVLYVRV